MKRYILTGPPGAGKTTILRRLADAGHQVVEEAATAVIARAQARGEDEPWTRPSFIDEIVAEQHERIERADRAAAELGVGASTGTGAGTGAVAVAGIGAGTGIGTGTGTGTGIGAGSGGGTDTGIQFHDRSPVCTYALSLHLGWPPSPALTAELERIARERVFERRVFFVRDLGFIEPTAARRISFEQAVEFGRVHEESYRAFGYELVEIPTMTLDARVAAVLAQVGAFSSTEDVTRMAPQVDAWRTGA